MASILVEPLEDVRKRWLKALTAAGLAGREGLTFHSTRHSFATHFLTGGGNVRDLQAQLGHSRLETTQRYADTVSERRRATVMGMDIAGGTQAHTRSRTVKRA